MIGVDIAITVAANIEMIAPIGMAWFGHNPLKEQAALRVHTVGHPRLVGAPGHEIRGTLAFAEQIFPNGFRPDELVRTQSRECGGHLARIEKTLVLHQVFEKRDLGCVDEQHEISVLAEIGLRGQQCDGGEPFVAIARHGGGGDRKQSAAKAISTSMNVPLGRRSFMAAGIDDGELFGAIPRTSRVAALHQFSCAKNVCSKRTKGGPPTQDRQSVYRKTPVRTAVLPRG